MSNTTPGPEDERVPESGPPIEPDAPADKPIEAEPDADIPAEPAADAQAESSADDIAEPVEPVASETVTAAYATDEEAAPAWASEPTTAEPTTAEPTASEPTVAEPTVAEQASAPEPTVIAPVVAPVTPVYVTAPTPPKAKGNRGVGILIAVLAAVAYAIVYAAVSLGWFALNVSAHNVMQQFESYVVSWAFWVPVAAFFVVLVLLIAIVNRGGWWAYILGGFVVAVIVYFAYIGGALLQVQAWTLTAEQANRLVGQLWTNPLTLGAAIVAREATIWFGAWIAARGKRVRQRNLDAQRDFDREVATGPLSSGALGSSASSSWSNR